MASGGCGCQIVPIGFLPNTSSVTKVEGAIAGIHPDDQTTKTMARQRVPAVAMFLEMASVEPRCPGRSEGPHDLVSATWGSKAQHWDTKVEAMACWTPNSFTRVGGMPTEAVAHCLPGSSQWNAKRIFRARNVIFYSSNLIIIRTPISHTKRPSATPSPGRLARVPAIHLLSFVETKGGKETHVKQHTVIPRFQHQQPSNTKIQEHQTVCPWFRHQSSIRNFISLLENKHTKRNVRNLCTRFRRLFGFAVGPPAGLEAMARISLPLISIS